MPLRSLSAAAAFALWATVAGWAAADTFHVRAEGIDSDERDGRSGATAWASPAYALSRLPEAPDLTLQLGPGRFVIHETLTLPDGLSLRGNSHEGGGHENVRIHHNLMHQLVEPPDSAGVVAAPEFDHNDDPGPWGRYRPRPGGNLDQTGADVGLPFHDRAPSIGAFEAGAGSWWDPQAVGPEAPVGD